MVNENNTDGPDLPESYRYTLLSLYTTVLLGGVVSMSLMIRVLKSNIRSVTTTAVLNLIAVHVLFLLTLPFRIYYYAAATWALGQNLCKVISAMIHVHMYLTFVFYLIILVHRHMTFFKFTQVEFYRSLHALWASVAVWGLVLVVVVPVMVVNYGSLPRSNTSTADDRCFHFGAIFSKGDLAAAALNHTLSVLLIVVTLALAVCQVWILGSVYKVHRERIFIQQEFLAQLKSISFLLVIVICFVPYNIFRIYYVSNYNASLQVKNEIALAVTTFSCFDMLILMGKELVRL